MASAQPFAGLSPERILRWAEAAGLAPDGHLFALNSYENRVYRLGLDDGSARVLKFYRPERWSDAQILEEHAFTLELAAAELPVAAPLAIGGQTLLKDQELRVAVFPLCPGGAPDVDQPGVLELMGRTLGRWHALGALRPFLRRPTLGGERLGARARAVVLASPLLPQALSARYEALSGQLLAALLAAWDAAEPVSRVRLHGDCHRGNILWRTAGPVQGPLFVDLDDCMNGPRMQDLWMFLSGTADEQRGQWAALMVGYETFSSIDYGELRLIEALRAARMLNHAAWVAERWQDPAFPRAFPWIAEPRWWEQHCNDLAEQCEAVGEPPLSGS
ncbi:MAG TPA: serine/threonine protein kinase [Steroidobacteraceae bacterium]|nr:serine/threonine protein kinase [Steroidobacteraceae bacterium]